jgi:TonB-linked SusC/RagA family outer membrane protein
MRKIALLAIAMALLVSSIIPAVNAQTKVAVQGVVKDEKGSPLGGATVAEKGYPGNVVVTDTSGRFVLMLKGKGKDVIISFIGYEDRAVHVAGDELSIALKPSKSNMGDVVVIGYQGMRRRNLTAAVSSIKGKDIQDIPEASFDQMLQGRLPGVSVLSSSGEPGTKLAIVIRGATNVDYSNANGGNSGPLYVIDGTIYDVNSITPAYTSYNAITGAAATTNPLSLINPNDIESIDVLKDASASAIYGARAGNGVIIVKTKRALRGKPQVNVSGYVGATTRPQFRKVYTGAAERSLKLALLEAQMGYNNILAGNIPLALTDSLNPAWNNDVDWQGLMIRSKALVNNQDVSVAGFAGSTNYRLSMDHYNEQGLLNGFSIDKMTPHLNLGINPLKGMKITTDLVISSEKRRHGTGGSSGTLFSSWNFPSSFVQLTPEQLALYKGQTNSFDDNRPFAFIGAVGLSDTIVSNLYFNSNFSYNNYTDKWAYFSPALLNGIQNTAYEINSNNPTWTFENYLTYLKSFNDHHLVAVGGFSAYDTKNYFSSASAAGIAVTGITTLQTVPSGANLSVSTTRAEKTTLSYYGRLSYDYKGKYLATVSLRRDASSIYSANYRWGNFPSFSAGWILSDEDFMKPATGVVNFFKLRASYGITGNDPGSWYGKYQSLYPDASYVDATTGSLVNNFGSLGVGGLPSTYNGTTVISPYPYYGGYYNSGVAASTSVRWEKVPQTDFGADIELFGSRINLAVDVYRKDAKDKYFYNIPAQITTGYSYYSGNFVDVRNDGLEIGLSTRNLPSSSKLQWNTTFNISFNRNYVTRLPNGNRDFLFGPPWFQQSLTIGEPLFNYKVYQIKGAYATDADVPVDPITGRKMTYQGSTLGAGDAAYVDMNGDYNINYDDKVIAGNPNPKVTGGFGNTFLYKGISLNIFCSFVAGRKIFNGALSDALNGSRDVGSWAFNSGPASLVNILGQFWTKAGDKAPFPRLVYPSGSAQDPWNIASSYFVEDGSFFKVKQVTLGYNLPAKWVHALKLKFINVYGMAENLLVLKKSKTIADPELVDPTTGTSNVGYPSALKFTAGFRVEL